MKTKTILIAAVMFLALSVSAFAQATFTVGSSPVTTVACCGQAEKSGDISFEPRPGSLDTVTGTIEITYPVPIANLTPINVPNGIHVTAVAANFSNPQGIVPLWTTIASVVNDPITGKGIVVISIGPGGRYPFNIDLAGVRLNVSGMCSSSPGTLSANISTTGNLITNGETTALVIRNVAPPFAALSSTGITLNAVTGAGAGTAYFQLREGYLNAFGVTVATDPSQNISRMIKLTVGSVPAGVTLTFPLLSIDSASSPTANEAGMFQLTTSSGVALVSPQVITSASGAGAAVYYRLVIDSDPTVFEYFRIGIGVASVGPYPLPSSSVSITAQFGPIDPTGTLIPRYDNDPACSTGPGTIVTIVGSSTTLLMPYAVNIQHSYNTGIAIANTTTDPGTGLMGFTQAVRQGGTMTFYFYPQTGAPFSYATSGSSPGTGLTAGSLPTGGSYVVLLSDLLSAAGASPNFAGYIIVITNFTNAHGQYFISDFEGFSNGALMLILNNDIVGRAGPERLDN